MQLIALMLIGFSLFTAFLLILGNLLQQFEAQQFSSKLAGFVLVVCLAVIQWLNLQFIVDSSRLIFSPLYIAILFCIAPGFYFYSRRLLTAEIEFSRWQILHALPLSSCLSVGRVQHPIKFLYSFSRYCWYGTRSIS